MKTQTFLLLALLALQAKLKLLTSNVLHKLLTYSLPVAQSDTDEQQCVE